MEAGTESLTFAQARAADVLVALTMLYNHSIAVAVGHRHLIAQVHVYCGFALLPPLLLGLASRDYREDLRRLNRFTQRDWQWLRSKKRRDGTQSPRC